ncbi:outer membrane protein OmpK [Shewanella maritima]|nr:outer membrane protein OmpK [Shewanella maritima]
MTATTAQAEQYYGFANVSVNYLDWSDGTEQRSRDEGGFGTIGAKSDFFYLEVEAGAGYDWGDVYGFIDFENPTKGNMDGYDDGSKAFRIAAKGSVAVNIGDTNWNYYGHLYSISDSSDFYEQNIVLGVSYDYNTDFGLWVKPFIGAHYLNGQKKAGFNGGMAGWVLGYNFKLGGQDMMITNWNEIEFARHDAHRGFCNSDTCTGPGDEGWIKTNGEDHGLNGAVALWWNATKDFTLGVQYRYANNKLGTPAYQNAAIFSAKYNF